MDNNEPGLATPYEAALVHKPTPVAHVGVSQSIALIGFIAMIAIGVVSIRVPFIAHEIVQEADLEALIAAYTGLSNALPQAKTTAERTRIKQEATVIIARIRTLVDTLPDDKVPAAAKRFKLVR